MIETHSSAVELLIEAFLGSKHSVRLVGFEACGYIRSFFQVETNLPRVADRSGNLFALMLYCRERRQSFC